MNEKKIKRTAFGLVLATFLGITPSQAQEAKPLPRHPDDVIKFEAKLDGPNADKFKSMTASLDMRKNPDKDQTGFSNSFSTAREVAPSSPRTFLIEMTVPLRAATGDYYLSLRANAPEASVPYGDGQEFNVPAIHVDNPAKFEPPSVTVKPLP